MPQKTIHEEYKISNKSSPHLQITVLCCFFSSLINLHLTLMPHLNSPAGKSILFTCGIALRDLLRSQSSLHDQRAGDQFLKGLSTHSYYHQVTKSLLLLALQICNSAISMLCPGHWKSAESLADCPEASLPDAGITHPIWCSATPTLYLRDPYTFSSEGNLCPTTGPQKHFSLMFDRVLFKQHLL